MFAFTFLDAAPAAQHAAAAYAHHAHHGPHFGGLLLGAGLALGAVAIVRAIRRRRRFGHGPRRALFHLFRRLDTSPSQEKVIREALDQLREGASGLRADARSARSDLGQAVAGETFDASAFEAAFAGPSARLAELRGTAAQALGRIHEVLTPDQRRELASMLRTGPGFFARRRHAC